MVDDSASEKNEIKFVKAHCPRCDGERACNVHGSFDQPLEFGDEDHHEVGQIDHRLLQCRGCETAFYWRSSWDSQDYDHYYNRSTGEEEVRANITILTYPTPEKKSNRPDWTWTIYKIDNTLAQIMGEVYQAVELRSFILASVGLRTALDRATELLGIDRTKSMAAKVEALLKGGWVGDTEAQTLGVVAEAGNAAAHRAWAPEEEDFRPLLTTLEQFIERALISGKRALEIGPKIPPNQRSALSKAVEVTP